MSDVRVIDAYEAVREERTYQDVRWGGIAHDREHDLGHFIHFIQGALDKARKADDAHEATGTIMVGRRDVLGELRQVAALAIAAMQAHGVVRREWTEAMRDAERKADNESRRSWGHD